MCCRKALKPKVWLFPRGAASLRPPPVMGRPGGETCGPKKEDYPEWVQYWVLERRVVTEGGDFLRSLLSESELTAPTVFRLPNLCDPIAAFQYDSRLLIWVIEHSQNKTMNGETIELDPRLLLTEDFQP